MHEELTARSCWSPQSSSLSWTPIQANSALQAQIAYARSTPRNGGLAGVASGRHAGSDA
jgi:hypothetical protein